MTLLRPPPGGPIAAQNSTSTMERQLLSDLHSPLIAQLMLEAKIDSQAAQGDIHMFFFTTKAWTMIQACLPVPEQVQSKMKRHQQCVPLFSDCMNSHYIYPSCMHKVEHKGHSLLCGAVADLSYQPWWSIHCLSSSTGGWAPYVSSDGMFRSSTKMMHFCPKGGP